MNEIPKLLVGHNVLNIKYFKKPINNRECRNVRFSSIVFILQVLRWLFVVLYFEIHDVLFVTKRELEHQSPFTKFLFKGFMYT